MGEKMGGAEKLSRGGALEKRGKSAHVDPFSLLSRRGRIFSRGRTESDFALFRRPTWGGGTGKFCYILVIKKTGSQGKKGRERRAENRVDVGR